MPGSSEETGTGRWRIVQDMEIECLLDSVLLCAVIHVIFLLEGLAGSVYCTAQSHLINGVGAIDCEPYGVCGQ